MLDGSERLGEARLDRPRQVVAQLLELARATSRDRRAAPKLLEPHFLGVVLLLGERVDLAELLAAAVVALELLGELVAILALGGLGVGGCEAPLAPRRARRRCGRARRRPPTGARRASAADWRSSTSARTKPAQVGAELRRPGGLSLCALAHRRLEPLDVDPERCLEPQRARVESLEHELVGTACPSRIGVGERAGGDARALGGVLGGLRGLVRERRELLGLRAQGLDVAAARLPSVRLRGARP